jgi:hypothetical protein
MGLAAASIPNISGVTGPNMPTVPGVTGAGAGESRPAQTMNAFVLTWEDFRAKVREAGVDISRLGWQ